MRDRVEGKRVKIKILSSHDLSSSRFSLALPSSFLSNFNSEAKNDPLCYGKGYSQQRAGQKKVFHVISNCMWSKEKVE